MVQPWNGYHIFHNNFRNQFIISGGYSIPGIMKVFLEINNKEWNGWNRERLPFLIAFILRWQPYLW